MKASFFYLRGVSPFCLCSLHLTSVPPACLPLYPPAAVPAPTLWVLQGQKEYFFGDAVTLVCTTPPSITGKLTYQIFGEAGWAVSGFSSTSNYTFEFVLSRMQHRGPHFCSYSLKQGRKQLISPTSEKLVIKIGDHLPQPLLTVESPLGEVMAGDLLSIICKAPGDATVRRFHFYRDGQEVLPTTEGSEDNAADHGGNLRTSMVLQLPRAGPQQSGNFTCKYEEKKPERWIPSFTSQAVSISINAQKKGKSCFLLLRLLVVGGCFLTINSLILLFFWARGRTKDASFLSGASPAGISQLHARSPHTLQEENKYEEH
ncbi:Fc receptor-like protein 5 isoform X2 [Anser cygnoides]|uniref:Fc receptor-like protein 5 isoform X2 n=1 Tax=Anser cygnoides TaxID=8845 RepID=UPI0034D2F68E